MNFERDLLRRIAVYAAISAGLAWAVFVIVRYMGVDNNFVSSLVVHITINHLLILVVMFLSCVLFGYTAGQNTRRKIIIGAFSLIVMGLVVVFMHSYIQSTWLKVNNLTDGMRASLLIATAALAGVGIGVGTRISQRPLTLGFLATYVFLPFLYIALRAEALTSLLALVWIFLLADAIGMISLRWLNNLGGSPSAFIERAGLLSIATGLAILILATLALGLIGGSSVTGILLMLLSLTVLCFKQIKSSLMRLTALPWSQPVALSEFELGGLAMLTSLFFIYWIGALAPEVGADALGGRAAMPAIWLRDGGIHALPEMLYSYAMFGGEMLYLLVMPFTGYPAAKVIQFGLSVLLVMSAFTQVFELRHRKEAALILFAFWGCTQVWWQMIWGFADLSQMFFYFVCILALRFWLDEPESHIWLIAAGIAGATSTSVKLNGGGALVIAGLVVVGGTLYQTRSLAKTIKNSLYLVIPSLLCLLPWLIRSYWLTQNPIFPFVNEIFKSPLIVSLSVASFGVGLAFPKILTVPWGIFFEPAVYGSFTYHPLILALALLGFIGLAWVSSRKEWLWLGAGLLAYIAWLVTEQNSRYSLIAIYFLALAFGIGLLKWQDKFPFRFQRAIFQALLLSGLIWGFGMQALRPSFWLQSAVSGQAFPAKVVLGGQSESDYLKDYVPTYFCAQWLNQHYSQNAKVWQMPPIRDHLYFDANASSLPHGILSITDPLNEILLNPVLASDYAAIYQSLAMAGYTHFLYSTSSLGWYVKDIPEPQRGGVFSPAFEDAYLQVECADRGMRLYKIHQMSTANLSQVQPDLLANSGFETLTSDELPLNWNFSGVGQIVHSDGNNIFELEQDATLSQAITVNDGITYELSAEYNITSSASLGYIQITWLDSSGQLRMFSREAFNPAEGFDSYRFLQTVPDGVQTVIIYVFGSGIEVDNVVFREIAAEVQVP
jgi:hypothetical protein